MTKSLKCWSRAGHRSDHQAEGSGLRGHRGLMTSHSQRSSMTRPTASVISTVTQEWFIDHIQSIRPGFPWCSATSWQESNWVMILEGFCLVSVSRCLKRQFDPKSKHLFFLLKYMWTQHVFTEITTWRQTTGCCERLHRETIFFLLTSTD